MDKQVFSTKLKIGDEVVVISGKNRKSKGKLLAIDKQKGRVIIQGVNLSKRFTRPTQENPKGGVLEIERSIHISNVMLFDPKSKKGTRIRFEQTEGKKNRIAVASGKKVE